MLLVSRPLLFIYFLPNIMLFAHSCYKFQIFKRCIPILCAQQHPLFVNVFSVNTMVLSPPGEFHSTVCINSHLLSLSWVFSPPALSTSLHCLFFHSFLSLPCILQIFPPSFLSPSPHISVSACLHPYCRVESSLFLLALSRLPPYASVQASSHGDGSSWADISPQCYRLLMSLTLALTCPSLQSTDIIKMGHISALGAINCQVCSESFSSMPFSD